MKRWLALALVGLAVIWGPYVYSELVAEPVETGGKQRSTLRLFGDDDSEEPAAEDPSEEAEPEPEPEEEEAPAAAAEKPAEEKPSAEAEKAAEPEPTSEGDKGDKIDQAEDPAHEAEHPTLPSDLLPAFRKVFDAEPRDAFWANDEEAKVRVVFTSAGATPDTLSEVACRKTVCRVTFVPDEFEIEALGKLYEALLTRHPEGLALDHKAEPVGQRGTLFLLRAGYKLEH